MSAGSVQSAKAALRREMRARLARECSAASVAAQSAAVRTLVLNHPAYIASQTVSVYANMPSGEIATAGIIEQIMRDGKQCLLPRFSGNDEMEMVHVRDWPAFCALPLNAWKIPEPPQSQRATAAVPDLVLMPGLAFDRKGWRLGHGRGYYDRFLARIRAAAAAEGLQRPTALALALREQILPEQQSIPKSAWDVRPDGIIVALEPVEANG